MDAVRLEPPAELDMPIGEAMFTQRAIRRLDSSRSISDAQIELMLNAASKAPNGGNTQPGRFLVIRDRELIKGFGKIYHQAWWAKRRDEMGWTGWEDIPADSVYRLAAKFADEAGDAPLVILAFSVNGGAANSIFPGVQNLLLAARAMGIGSVLTTLHSEVLDDLYTLFAIPDDASFHCCLPLGYPRGNFGLTPRMPTAQTTHWNKWDASPPWK